MRDNFLKALLEVTKKDQINNDLVKNLLNEYNATKN